MNYQRPVSKRKTVQLLVAITILAWATQTLISQWGFGQEAFVPRDSVEGILLEVKSEATITGSDVKLKQIVRWSDRDSDTFAPIADLVVARIPKGSAFVGLSIRDLRTTLEDAGVNLAGVRFVGAASTTVHRTDTEVDSRTAMKNWVAAKEQSLVGGTGPTTAPAPTDLALPTESKTLKQLLTEEVSQRLNLPVESLQVNFKAEDDRMLGLNDSQYKVQITPLRARGLGPVDWDVVLSNGKDVMKGRVSATVRAWQVQLLTTKPIPFRQVLTERDFVEKRVLVEFLPAEAMLAAEAAVGQQAARELKAGTVLTARLVEPVELIRRGQFVTITSTQGSVAVTTVAKAMEGGSIGQTIRVKNETTGKQFDVIVSGAQTASVLGSVN